MRVSEWVVAVFFTWTTVLALVLPVSGHIRARTVFANVVVLLLYVWLFRLQRYPLAQMTRDWFPQALMILAYKQMGWFAPATHTNFLEHQWIIWDRLLLNRLHGRAIIESLGPILPSLLELSYALVYAVPPITMAVIYAYRAAAPDRHITDDLSIGSIPLLCAISVLAVGAATGGLPWRGQSYCSHRTAEL